MTAAFAAITLASVVIMNLYPTYVVQTQIITAKEAEMLSSAGVLSAALQGLSTLSAENITTAIAVLDVVRDRRILVVDDSGIVIYDSSKTSNLIGRIALFPEIVAALQGNDAFRCVYTSEMFESRAAAPVVKAGREVGAVFLYDYDTDNAAFLGSLRANTVYISLVVLFVGTVSVASLMLTFGRRLENLMRGVRRVGTGEYSVAIGIRGSDELGELAHEFNELSARLGETERLRRQFVSDASHELKTPLAAIRLLSDSIIQARDITIEEVREFLSDIYDEIDRMARITESLLYLSNLDSLPEVTPVCCDVGATVGKCAELLRVTAAFYGVAIRIDAPGEYLVRASQDGLHHIVFNLMENAVKYNREGGDVDISLARDGDEVVLTVRDTGIGIPQAELPLLFERFYRVDKTRSRATGGTGLGLSIAREWVLRFGGRIEVESALGEWTAFRVFFQAYE